jgi:hypothetical protein
MSFISLQGPPGQDGRASIRVPALYKLSAPVDDMDALAQTVNGMTGDLYMTVDGRLFQLLNQSGAMSLAEVATLAGPEGPKGSDSAGRPHTPAEHGGPWTFRAGNYGILAHGPDPSTLTMQAVQG